MTDAENLVVRNLLNGVDPASAGLAAQITEGEVTKLFTEAMRHVAEYALVHCLPLIECGSLPAARRNRRQILEVIDAVMKWDASERDMVIAILKGRNVMKDGVPRETAETLVKRTLDALPNYLLEAHVSAYHANRTAFVRDNRGLVIAAVERFVSFREPFLYKTITHVLVTPANAGAIHV